MSFSEDPSERVPVTAPAIEPRERVGLSLGRIINGVILLIHVAMFITSLCVIGLVGALVNNIETHHPILSNATQSGACPFYVGKLVQGSPNPDYYPLAPTGVCLWFIAGHVILAIAAIVFFIVGIVRIVFAME